MKSIAGCFLTLLLVAFAAPAQAGPVGIHRVVTVRIHANAHRPAAHHARAHKTRKPVRPLDVVGGPLGG